MKMKRFAGLLVLGGIVSQSVVAQDGTEPYTDAATLGFYLESVYTNLLKDCQVVQPKLKQSVCMLGCKEKVVSSVPSSLQEQKFIPMDSKVLWNNRIGLARAFAFVYNENSMSSFGTQSAESSDWLLYQNELEIPLQTALPSGVTRGVYVHDCGGILTSAAKANAGYDFTLGHLKAALSASYSGETKKNIVVAYGRFESPFLKMYRGSADPAHKVKAVMRLYDWYSSYKHTGGEMLLSSVNNALSVFGVYESIRGTTGSIDIDGAVTAGFATAGLSGKASAKESRTIDIKDFSFAVTYNGLSKADVNFQPMDSPSEVAAQLAQITPTLDESTIVPAVPGTRVVHKVRVPGLEPEYCRDEKKLWTVDVDDTEKAPTLISNKIVGTPQRDQACEFTIEYLVPAEFATTGKANNEFTLVYAIGAINKMTDKDGNKHALRFGKTQARYPISRSPEIFPSGSVAEPILMDPDILSWNFSLVFREELTDIAPNARVDWTKSLVIENVGIVCLGQKDAVPSYALRQDSARKTAAVTIELIGDSKQFAEWKLGISNLTRCTAKGSVRFPTKQPGTFVTREFSAPIRFPSGPSTVADYAAKP